MLYDSDGAELWRTPFPSYLRFLTVHGTTLFAIDDVVTRWFENTTIAHWGSPSDSLFVYRYELSLDSLMVSPRIAYPLVPPAWPEELHIVLPYK